MTGYNLRFWADYYPVDILDPVAGTYRPGNLRRIHLYQKGYDGNPFEMHRPEDHILTAESVVTIESVSDGEELFGAIVGRKAQIQLVVDDHFALEAVYSNSERDFWITIDESVNSGLSYDKNLFTGWVSAWDVKEPYTQAPYVVQITASCGLASLKNIPYSSYPTKAIRRGIGNTNEALQHCLAHVGYDLPIYTSLPLAEEANQLPTPGVAPAAPFSPLVYLKHDEQLFQGKSCYDALKTILQSMGARLCQQDGAFRISRWGQFSHPITNAPIGFNPEYIQWRDNGSLLSGTPPVGQWLITERIDRRIDKDADGLPLQGGSLFFEPIYHRAEVAVAYGDDRNEMPNGDFSDVTGLLPTGFTPRQPGIQARRIGEGTVDNPYALQIDGYSDTNETKIDLINIASPYIEVPSRNGTTLEADLWKLSLTYINRNTRGVKLQISATTAKTTFYLQNDGTWKDRGRFSYYYTHDNFYPDGDKIQKAKPTRGINVEIEMPEVPDSGAYKLQIAFFRGRRLDGQLATPSPQIEIRDVRLSRRDSSKEPLKGERYIAALQTTDPVRSVDETTLTLADQRSAKREYLTAAGFPPVAIKNTYYRFRTGAMRRVESSVATSKWQTRPSTFHESKPLAQILAYERLALTGAIRRGFEGDLFCVEPIRPLDVLVFPEIRDASNQPIRMLILSHSIGDFSQIARVRAVEIPGQVAGAIDVMGYWETQDGVLIPMDDNEDNLASAGPGKSKAGNELLKALIDKRIANQLLGSPLLPGIRVGMTDGQGHAVLPPGAPEQLVLKVKDAGILKYIQPTTRLLNAFGLKIK
ncbi:hypothetical protein [Larkinella humicola]|uniref:Tail protein n=1 Tax=Larkinella humicola TaxID=2607654 RepID=A0A5N1JM72_9BACT|nr:hypothetical protein [Larkinella humicola]KAA9357241.1 hypothetical protein F0P93_05755 [Larkinella humicola]